MNMKTIGKNIRKYRLEINMKQEKLAELTNLSPNYIGMLERADKIPSLTTLINIANALNVTADMLLCDVLSADCEIAHSQLLDKIGSLPPKDKQRIYAVIETLLDFT
ncbi:MAG: helix-turn-helix transcriptional regulator [Ruminococcus sp.]|nr:helix-turn-helix transcriptional regulator [Ruminococcus sp.]